MRMREILKALAGIGELSEDANIESVGDPLDTKPSMLVFAENERFLNLARKNPSVSCLVAAPELARGLDLRCAVLATATPRKTFFTIHNYLATQTSFYWEGFASEVSSDAIIHPTAYVASKSVRIGHGTVIEPGVKILERSIIGSDVTLRAGTVVGSQGFGFVASKDGVLPIAHGGGVRLHDRVEIQANCVISRAQFGGFTEIGEDTKLDNLVHVAHAVSLGRRCLVAAGTTIAGTVEVGDDVWIGPGACISDHVTIGSGAKISLGAVVVENVNPGQRVSGNFAVGHETFLTHLAAMKR